MVMLKNIEYIKSFIHHQEKPNIKEINALKSIQTNSAIFLIILESSKFYMKKKIKRLNILIDS